MKILLLLLPLTSFSWSGDINKFCSELIEIKKNAKIPSKLKVFKDIFFLKVTPWKLAKPFQIRKKESSHFPRSTYEPLHVLFLLGPPSNYSPSEEEYENWIIYKRKKTSLTKKIQLIARSKSVRSCLNKASSINFDPMEYINLLEESYKYDYFQLKKEIYRAKKELKQVVMWKKLSWNIYDSSNLNDLLGVLHKPNLASLIIVSHGRKDGKISDSVGSIFPYSFFDHVGPNLTHFALFSCYGKTSLRVYNLFDRYPISTHSQKYLYRVRNIPSVASGQLAPLKGFSYFFRNVDRKISKRVSRWKREAQLDERKICAIKTDLQVLSGSFGLFLNNKIISQHDPFNKSTFKFPCSFLRNKNLLVLKSLYKVSKVGKLKKIPEEISLNNQVLTLKKVFRRPNGELRSVFYQ